jgi:hypothetical protein
VAFVVASTNSTGAADREAWREKLVDIVRARGWLGETAEPRTENREPR